jgi:hypothetical protein
MKGTLLRMGLMVGLGWGLAVVSASAQAPNPLPNCVDAGGAPNGRTVTHVMHCVEVPVITPPSNEPERPRPVYNATVKPVCDCVHRHGFICWTPLNWPGCSSISSQFTFMFGSCRQWFGESCVTRALPDPFVPASNGGGCNCRP